MALQIDSTAGDHTALSGTSNTVTKPSGVVEGDLLIGFGASQHGAAVGIALPAGFTKVRDFDHTAGGPGGGWGFKIAGASEPASYLYDYPGAGSGNNRFAIMLRISGHDPAVPINAEGIAPEHLSAISQDPRIVTPVPDISTTVKGCLILRLIAVAVNGALDRGAPLTYFVISGVVASLAHDEPTPLPAAADSAGGAIFSEDVLQAAAGPTGPATFSVDLDNANIGQTIRAFALTAAVAPFPSSGAGGGMGGPAKKPITKADVLAAREHAKAIGAKVRTKFDQRRR